ncbi:MAG: hypothetical protein AAF650_08505 [Pseudomonadota bacterium]
MILELLISTPLALVPLTATRAEPDAPINPILVEESEGANLSGASLGFGRNVGAGNWESFSFVLQNDEAESVSMTLCPDQISRYSIKNPEQEREFAFAVSTGEGRWAKTCRTYTIKPGDQLVRHAYFKYGDQDGRERLFVLDTNLAQITFVARRVQNGAPGLGNFQ